MPSRQPLPNLRPLLVDYTRTHQTRGTKTDTIRDVRRHVGRLAAAYPRTHVLRLTAKQINAFLVSLDVLPSTRTALITRLRSFYRWAHEEGHTSRNPAAELEWPKVPKRLPRPIPDRDLAVALDVDDPRMKVILSLMAYEGARCIEVARLRGEDIDTSAMTVRLYGKGDKERTVPLHTHTLDSLRAYRLPRRGPVVVVEEGWEEGHQRHPLSHKTISKMVSAALPPDITAHQLRHWFGTMFYRGSRDLLLTQAMMGHSTPATTVVYAQADVSKAAAVTNGLKVTG